MTLQPDYDTAIRAMWTGRDLQAQRQIESGTPDAGTRGSVTGGQHLTPLQQVIAEQFAPLVEMGAQVRQTGAISIPGFYRRTKDWDIVVTYKDFLVGAVECKSQVGSFGNNVNNRAEESIGNAVDIWESYRANLLGSVKPWLAYVYVIEHAPGSTRPVRERSRPIFPTDPVFDQSTYIGRIRILCQRLVREQLYDAACVISTERSEGIHSEPSPELSTLNLTAAIAGRVAYVRGLEG